MREHLKQFSIGGRIVAALVLLLLPFVAHAFDPKKKALQKAGTACTSYNIAMFDDRISDARTIAKLAIKKCEQDLELGNVEASWQVHPGWGYARIIEDLLDKKELVNKKLLDGTYESVLWTRAQVPQKHIPRYTRDAKREYDRAKAKAEAASKTMPVEYFYGDTKQTCVRSPCWRLSNNVQSPK